MMNKLIVAQVNDDHTNTPPAKPQSAQQQGDAHAHH